MTRSGTVVRLSEVAEINPRLRIGLPPDTAVSFVPMAAVDAENARVISSDVRRYSEVSKGYTPFRRGDVLLAKITPCFENGKIAQAEIPHEVGFGSTEFHVIRPSTDSVDTRYLLHLLRQNSVRRAGERRMTGSGGQRRVPAAFLSEMEVWLPPIQEQQRVVEVLDRVEELRLMRKASLGQLEVLAQSVFVDWFGDPRTNPRGWRTARLGEVADLFAGNSLPEGESYTGQDGGFFLAKVSDMNAPGNEESLVACREWTATPGARSGTCPPGAVVIPKRGGAIGTNKKRIATRPTILDPNLMGIAARDGALLPEYLFQWFLQLDLSTLVSGSSVPQLNKQDLAPLCIAVPPHDLQDRFAKFVARLRDQRSRMEASMRAFETLFDALEQRAFSGQL